MSVHKQAAANASAACEDNLQDLDTQRSFWTAWNTTTRELKLEEISLRQRTIVLDWLTDLERTDLDLLEVGCGAGWLVPDLAKFGRVTATDFAEEVVRRASARHPGARFVAGDFMALDLGEKRFDVVVCLEVLSCVNDQRAFLEKIALHLRPGGWLMLATPNRPVLQRFNRIALPKPGNIRKWTDAEETRALLSAARFDVAKLFSVTPIANRGILRLVNSRRLNAPVRWLVGDLLERCKEKLGLGWTLMALARKA